MLRKYFVYMSNTGLDKHMENVGFDPMLRFIPIYLLTIWRTITRLFKRAYQIIQKNISLLYVTDMFIDDQYTRSNVTRDTISVSGLIFTRKD